ncbi:MAG: cell division protein FtsB [Gammaproteobacteria bacterium]|nr:cell division protein FtsB [Gammaproteobacteria bacterium]
MRVLIAALAVILIVLQLRLWVAEGGLREVWRLEAQVAARTEENRRLAERNAALAAEVEDLRHGLAAAEERARSELGLVLPEESFYQIVPYDTAARFRGGGDSASAEEDVDRAAAAVSSIR